MADLDKTPVTTTRLYFPRFDVQNRYGLEPALAALGMTLAFDATRRAAYGSFRPRCRDRPLDPPVPAYRGRGGHVASAATAVAFATVGGTSNLVQFDHPFFFLVRDRQTNSFLFLGCVVDPAVGS